MFKNIITDSNPFIDKKLFQQQYKNYKPVLDQIKLGVVDLNKNGTRVVEQAFNYKPQNFHGDTNTSITIVIESCPPEVSTFERAVGLQTSSVTLGAKLIKIASETLDSDTFVSFVQKHRFVFSTIATTFTMSGAASYAWFANRKLAFFELGGVPELL